MTGPAGAPLQLLLIEDSNADVELIEYELRRSGQRFVSRRVASEPELLAALAAGVPDLVISDYSMPGYTGTSALATVRQLHPEVPFIFVSGTIGEERAIEALRSGATDYVLKDRLSRLIPAIERALAEVRDRQQRRRLQAQLIESQKMEAVGRLASGVAHDFNNLLSVILANVELAGQLAEAGEPPGPELSEIREAAQRAASLTRRLLTISRNQPVEASVFDANRLILDLERMLRSLMGEDATIELALAATPLAVRADPGQIEQILLNLVINARDAIGAGGRVILGSGLRTPAPDQVARPGSYVVLSVRDNGHGMSPEIMSRMFEPFFTTKPPGKGTGLGLATSQAIARDNDGVILVHSTAGQGSVFELLLPRVEESVGSRPNEATAVLAKGSERILLVEDDPMLSAVETRVLTMLGYQVVRCARGEEALGLLGRDPGFDLLITDVVLPGIGGVEVANEARKLWPRLRVLFVSGYADHQALDEMSRSGLAALLPKPFLLPDFATTVRQTLDG
jgi:two-component system, cell cycle sensor histidine kinase and response regulator CckA